jgi:heme/copper-type cytochrome/quinol oxidase subunit 1
MPYYILIAICILGIGSGLLPLFLDSEQRARPAVARFLALITVICCSYVLCTSLVESFPAARTYVQYAPLHSTEGEPRRVQIQPRVSKSREVQIAHD